MAGFEKVKSLEKYKEEGLSIHKEKEGLLELGNGFELDLEQLDLQQQTIEGMNLPDNVKQKAILKIQRAKLELQKAYEEKVEKPLEEKERELEEIQKEMEDVAQEVADAIGELQQVDINTGGVEITGEDVGVRELEEEKSAFEKEMHETIIRQNAFREYHQKQKIEILRHNISGQ